MDGILVIHMMYVPTLLTTEPSIAVADSGWPWLRLWSITCHLWPAPGLCPLLPIMPGLRCTIEDLRWRDVIISFLHSPNDTFHQPPIFSRCICIEGCRDAAMVLWSLSTFNIDIIQRMSHDKDGLLVSFKLLVKTQLRKHERNVVLH